MVMRLRTLPQIKNASDRHLAQEQRLLNEEITKAKSPAGSWAHNNNIERLRAVCEEAEFRVKAFGKDNPE